SEMDPEKNNITIYFLADPDELDNASLAGNYSGDDTSTWGMKYVYEMAKLYEAEFDFIKVDTLDLKKDAEILRTVYASTVGTKFDELDVIIDNCADGKTHNFRIISRDAFFSFANDTNLLYAANGEYKFTSTILSLSGSNPTAYFIFGHGEPIGALNDLTDFGEAQELAKLFAESGFALEKIDLSKEDFPKDEVDSIVTGASIAVVFGPTSDYITSYAGGTVNEITKLRDFVNAENHHMMVFMDSKANKLNALEEYLYDFWGVNFSEGEVIADTSDERTSPALSDDGKAFVADYETNTEAIGYSLTKMFLTELDSIPDIFVNGSKTISIKNEYTNISGAYEKERTSTLFTSPVFYAPELSATVYKNGEIDAYSSKVYDAYYDKLYELKYNEAIEYFTSRYDDVYKAVKEKMHATIVLEKYDELYAEKYREIYNKYLDENPLKEGEDRSALVNKAMDFAEETLEKDKELLESFTKEAELYADTKIENITDDIKAETEIAIKNFANDSVNDFIEKKDPSAVMTLTYEIWSNELSNNRIPTYVLACGSTSFVSDDAFTAVYGNKDMLYYTMRVMGKEIVPFDIDFVVIKSEALNTLGVNTKGVTALICLLPALTVIAIGAVVLVKRRKHM
ncbi:MAG: hypothetical protein IJF55_02615, partial [Clostridia bacterium]|nr:hypothetical protein [Clostridia bacterium]